MVGFNCFFQTYVSSYTSDSFFKCPIVDVQYVFNTHCNTESLYRNISQYGFGERYSPLSEITHKRNLGFTGLRPIYVMFFKFLPIVFK